MKYLDKTFTVGAPVLKDGKNTHGQTWEQIFGTDTGNQMSRQLLSEIRKFSEDSYERDEAIAAYFMALDAEQEAKEEKAVNKKNWYESRQAH